MTARPQPQHPSAPAATSSKATYQAPKVDWEEDFEPAGQVTGCADVADNCPDRPETV